MAVHIYNTLTRVTETLRPIVPGQVKIYVCGPTVYADPHLGHARSAVIFDVVRRYLVAMGLRVILVRNITDIDDKIVNKARRRGLDVGLLSDYYTYRYQGAMARLNVLAADAEPKASAHLPQIQAFIAELIHSGHAYRAGTDVYFAVNSIANYGRLSGRIPSATFETEASNNGNQGKRNPADFVLWKAARPPEPAWWSPWGMGRPGWHIECSAMSIGLLGEVFDIHGGGADLIFPHHENEIAQAVGRFDKVPARVWMHHGMVTTGGRKISKSFGRYVSLYDLLKQFPADAIRFFLLSKRYRNPLEISDTAMTRINKNLRRLYSFFTLHQNKVPMGSEDETSPCNSRTWCRFRKAMDEDFNFPMALSAVFEGIRKVNRKMNQGSKPVSFEYRDLQREIRDIFWICREVLGLRGDDDMDQMARNNALSNEMYAL